MRWFYLFVFIALFAGVPVGASPLLDSLPPCAGTQPFSGAFPQFFDAAEVAVRSEDYALKVTHASLLDRIGSSTPPTDQAFLVLQGCIYNQSASVAQDFYSTDFRVGIGDQRRFDIDETYLTQARQSLFPDAPALRPFRSVCIGCPDPFRLAPDQMHSIVLVFAVPAAFDTLRIEFGPAQRVATIVEANVQSAGGYNLALQRVLAPNEPTPTPIFTPTFTPSPSPSPTATLPPTATPPPVATLPSDLAPAPFNDILPGLTNADDIAVVNGNFAVQLTRVRSFPTIADSIANPGNTYMVIEAVLFNQSNSYQDFFDGDFVIDHDTAANVRPNLDAMVKAKTALFAGDLRFPDVWGLTTICVINCRERLNVEAHFARRIFIVYEVPISTGTVTLKFAPNGQPPAILEFWLIPSANSGYDILKITENNARILYVRDDVSILETIVQAEPVEQDQQVAVENCTKTIPITAQYERFQRTETYDSSRIDFAANLELGAVFGIPVTAIPIPVVAKLQADFKTSFEHRYSQVEQDTVTLTATLQPGQVLVRRSFSQQVRIRAEMTLISGSRSQRLVYEFPSERQTIRFTEEACTFLTPTPAS